MASVTIQAVKKSFGDVPILHGVDIDIPDGSFTVLVGPSGCGKSTLLRMIAGLEEIHGGEIRIGEKRVNDLPPKERDIAMVFQNYALYPHMTVRDNMAFSLTLAKADKATIASKVQRAAEILALTPLLERYPRQLSGGQRQRVALARSLAKRPKVLLLDEPLGALDRKLREETQFELMDIQQDLGLTFLIVTHDQEEAMTVSDRIAVMDKGEIVQVATPAEIYEAPNSRYVADFIGDINILEGKFECHDPAGPHGDVVRVACEGFTAVVEQQCNVAPGQDVAFAVRPEKIRISPEPPADTSVNALHGEVWDIGYLGDFSVFLVKLEGGRIVRAAQANISRLVDRPISVGDPVWLSWRADAGIVLTR